MMKAKLLSLALVLILLAFPRLAKADGIIVPEPPICLDDPCPPLPCPDCFPWPPMAQLAIRYHQVKVTIQDQIAVTHVDQVFYNPNDWAVEGTYLFPLPLDAAVSSLTLWVDGQPVEGKVLDADQARQMYQEIVSSLRDPALLEYAGRGALQASIFPIPPKGERRIELEYSQALAAEGGLVRYIYPLSTEKFSALPLENVTINVAINSSQPIRAVYSPSHTVAISQDDVNHARAGYEESNVLPTSDFALFYSIGENQAFHLLTFRDPTGTPGDPSDIDGFFLLLLAPQPDAAVQAVPKDVIVVLDRSGSMEGEKFQQAQQALEYILTHLNPDDRFNLIAFSTGVENFMADLRPASEAAEALPWVDRLSAEGSTDINRALLEAAALAAGNGGERPVYLLFLTDGLPTEGEIDSQKILVNIAGAAPRHLRLFAFGVGYDVDTFLLDSLVQAHHGASTYVAPGERLDEILSSFYAKISTPVLTDLQLDFGGVPVYDLYPSPLPDLFAGSQVVVAGRYRDGGTAVVTLTGTMNGQAEIFHYPDQTFASEPSFSGLQSSLPRLWATRKIGYLLNQIRLQGPSQETVDQIVRLSIRYGIVTPYTSYLVTEPMPLGVAEQERIAEDQFNQLQATAAAPASGQAAVQKAAGQGALSVAEAPATTDSGAANLVRIVGARTFVNSEGVWMDTTFDPQMTKTVKIPFLSKEYFILAESRPELAGAFALGQRVIAGSAGMFYEVVESAEVDQSKGLHPNQTPGTPSGTGTEAVSPAAGVAGTPVSGVPERSPASSRLPCPGGLLPLALAPMAGLIARWRRKVS